MCQRHEVGFVASLEPSSIFTGVQQSGIILCIRVFAVSFVLKSVPRAEKLAPPMIYASISIAKCTRGLLVPGVWLEPVPSQLS